MEKFIEFEKKRSVGSIIEVSMAFYKQEFKRFASSVFVVMMPILFAYAYSTKELMNFSINEIYNANYFISQFLGIVYYFFISLFTYEYLVLYAKGNKNITTGSLLSSSMRNMFKYIYISIISAIIVIISAIFFFLPAIYVAITLLPITFIARYENKGFGGAFKRCFNLIRGKWWKTFALLFVLYVLIMIISVIFSIPMMLQSITAVQDAMQDPGSYTGASFNVFYILLGQIGYILVIPILTIGVVINYFNLVARKEKKEILVDIDSIGQ